MDLVFCDYLFKLFSYLIYTQESTYLLYYYTFNLNRILIILLMFSWIGSTFNKSYSAF